MAVDGVQETWGKGTKFLRILPPCSFSVCCYIPLFMYPQSVIYSFHYLKRRILTTVYHEKGNNQENILSHERFPNYAMANYSQKLQNSKSCTLFFHKMITVPNMLAFFFFLSWQGAEGVAHVADTFIKINIFHLSLQGQRTFQHERERNC